MNTLRMMLAAPFTPLQRRVLQGLAVPFLAGMRLRAIVRRLRGQGGES
jgi:hypothetical protein